MKKCPHCAEEIQDEAKVCRFCQRDVVAQLDPLPKDAPVKKSNAGKWVLLFLLGMVALSWMFRDAPELVRTTAEVRSGTTPTPAPERLELLSSRGYASSSAYHSVEGQVKNLTGDPIDRIRVKVTWHTKSGEFITADEAMIDYQPLMPGQVSTFKTITTTNPLMETYRIEFAAGGRAINYRDSRK